MAHHSIISQEVVNLLTTGVFGGTEDIWLHEKFIVSSPTARSENKYDVNIEHCCVPVIHQTTGKTIIQYYKLANNPATREVWQTAYGKELGRMSQGYRKTGTRGNICIFVMTHDKIASTPADRVVTYARIVVDFCPQKKDPNRVQITAGGI